MNKNEIYFAITKTVSNGYERYRIQKQVDGHKINVTGKTKKEVTEKFYAKLEESKRQSKADVSIDINKITFADFVHYYLYDVVEPSGSIKESTLRGYESLYNAHIKNSVFSKTKLINMTTGPIQSFFNNDRYSKLSLSYVKQIKLFISIVLNYAVANDLILKNYTKNVRLSNKNVVKTKEKHKFLTDSEIKKLLEHCKDIQLKTIVILILNTGLRINEALALHVSDIQNGYVNVDKNLNAPKGRIVVSTPKTETSTRKIPINAKLQITLNHYIKYIKEKYLMFGITIDDDSIFFQNNKFNYIQASQLRKSLNAIYNKCNIETSGFHTLRHTFGSILYNEGVDIKTISTLLGHKNINVTANIYIHLQAEHKHNAVNLININ